MGRERVGSAVSKVFRLSEMAHCLFQDAWQHLTRSSRRLQPPGLLLLRPASSQHAVFGTWWIRKVVISSREAVRHDVEIRLLLLY
jgi:hypothetical protein